MTLVQVFTKLRANRVRRCRDIEGESVPERGERHVSQLEDIAGDGKRGPTRFI